MGEAIRYCRVVKGVTVTILSVFVVLVVVLTVMVPVIKLPELARVEAE